MVYNWLINSLSRLARQHCYLCGEGNHSQPDTGFCQACRLDLPKISPACNQCGTHVPSTFQHHEASSAPVIRCGPCLTQPPSFDRVIASFAYAEPIKQLIGQFKYQRQLAIGELFAHTLSETILSTTTRVEAILPVPLHPSRLRQRGFNQALELARPLAKSLSLPLLLDPIIRQKNTIEQSSLSAKERRRNLKKAFTIRQTIPYKAIAIVDDVMTTGSTVEELSVLLKLNGVDYVEVWCIARAHGGSA